jgi:hypothetical protein
LNTRYRAISARVRELSLCFCSGVLNRNAVETLSAISLDSQGSWGALFEVSASEREDEFQSIPVEMESCCRNDLCEPKGNPWHIPDVTRA